MRLRRWSWLLLLVAGISGAAAFFAGENMPPVYESSTTLLIHPGASGNGGAAYNPLFQSENAPTGAARLLRTRAVLSEVVARLKLEATPEALADQVTVSVARETQLIVLTVESSNPQRGADIANEIVAVFNKQYRKLRDQSHALAKASLQEELAKMEADLVSTRSSLNGLGMPTAPDQIAEQIRLQVLLDQQQSSYKSLAERLEQETLAERSSADVLDVADAAQPAKTPVRPKPPLYALMAATLGLMLALGGVSISGSLDNSVRSSADAERLVGIPAATAIGRIRGASPSEKLISEMDAASPIAAAYHQLAKSIEVSTGDEEVAEVGKASRTIAVTSSIRREGKSTTAANLAIALARHSQQVILVDANLRRPQLHKFFQQDNSRGLTTALANRGSDSIKQHLMLTGIDNLRLIPSGPQPLNPAQLLESDRMTRMVKELKAEADVVLFDTPPLLDAPDATLLMSSCDVMLLVVQPGVTPEAALAQARDRLAECRPRLLGLVLNRLSKRETIRFAQLVVARPGVTREAALARARDQLVQSGSRLLGLVLNRLSTRETIRLVHRQSQEDLDNPRTLHDLVGTPQGLDLHRAGAMGAGDGPPKGEV